MNLIEMIEIIKNENPNGLKTGSEETGYFDLNVEEYEAVILEWAKARLTKQQAAAKAEAEATAKAAAEAKLAALGLTADDLKALGL